jgi:hypothetical protein
MYDIFVCLLTSSYAHVNEIFRDNCVCAAHVLHEIKLRCPLIQNKLVFQLAGHVVGCAATACALRAADSSRNAR